MKKEEAQLGLRVRFRRPLRRVYVPGGHEQGHPLLPRTAPRKEWQPDEQLTEWRQGIVVGIRTLADGDYDHGGYDEQATFWNREHFTAILVVEDLRKNPLRCRPEDVELIPLLEDEW